MERRGILPSVEVDQSQVVRNDPFEWIQIEGTLQARNRLTANSRVSTTERENSEELILTYRNASLFAKETHADVVPKLRRIRGLVWESQVS